MDPFVVGIRFQRTGKIYHFDASQCRDLQVGDFAIVETSRGRQLGEVIQIVQNPTPPPEGAWKPIYNKATPRDLVLRQTWQSKEEEACEVCRVKLAELGIQGVKVVAAEFSFDGTRLSFLYSTEAEGKVDLHRLRTVMQRLYPHSSVEMRQIGPRDVAKFLGGMGACGMDSRCCTMFLTDFSPISIKMAKEQGISLTPSEITGMCGRLRCCLVYEYEQYAEARKSLPKRNKRVVTPQGEGKVIDVNPLKQTVFVELEGGMRREFSHAEIEPWDEMEALRKKAEAPCEELKQNGECVHEKAAVIAPGAAVGDEQPITREEKPTTRPDARPSQPGGRAGGRPGGQPDRRTDGQAGGRPGGQPGGRPGSQPGGRTGGQPSGQPGGRRPPKRAKRKN